MKKNFKVAAADSRTKNFHRRTNLPWTDPSIYQEFKVIKPIVNVVGAEVEAWAGSAGGGMQYVLPQTIIQLQQEGYIK